MGTISSLNFFALIAIKAKKFKDEIVPITVKIKKEDVVFDRDEYPKDGTTVEKLANLKPVSFVLRKVDVV